MKGILSNTIVYGSFDPLHESHLALFRAARAYGDRLIVGLSTDEFGKIKGKEHLQSYEYRTMMLYKSGLVDLVIPENDWNQKESDIVKYNISDFCMGEDWKGKFDNLPCKVHYFERGNVNSTSLKKKQDEIFNLLKVVRDRLDEASVKYWLDYGTLIGAVRDGDIIPHDTDADIGIMISDLSLFTNIDWGKYRLEYRKQGDFYRVYSSEEVYVDIFLWYAKGNFLDRSVYFRSYDKNKGKQIKISDIGNKTLKIRDADFVVPNNPKEFLNYRYKLGWIVPKIYETPSGE